MSEDVDGRQTRPANNVGRPDGSAERATVDGRSWLLVQEAAEAWADEKDGSDDAAAQAIRTAVETIGREVREGISRSEAPHGETPPDAEA